MGLAPDPRTLDQPEQTAAAKQFITITIRGTSYVLSPNNIPLSEKLIVRKATGGFPWEAFWNGEAMIGEDSVIIAWWLARRGAGEFNLTLTKAGEEWAALELDPTVPGDLEMSLTDLTEEAAETHPES